MALAISDVHLSHSPPRARANEPDWYAVMARQLDELIELAREFDAWIVIAGDLFDRWNSPPELINFALSYFVDYPRVLMIPGQHDLPNHRLDEAHRSAYWAVARHTPPIIPHAGYLFDWGSETSPAFICEGYPFGAKRVPISFTPTATYGDRPVIALFHDFVWRKKEIPYQGAPVEKSLARRKDFHEFARAGYRYLICGDNHQRFHHNFKLPPKAPPCTLINCGSFFRRHVSDPHHPGVWCLTTRDALFLPLLSALEDRPLLQRHDPPGIATVDGIAHFVQQLVDPTLESVDFSTLLERVRQSCSGRVVELLKEWLDAVHHQRP